MTRSEVQVTVGSDNAPPGTPRLREWVEVQDAHRGLARDVSNNSKQEQEVALTEEPPVR